MYCPNCGLDEKQPNQFCRACGTNLRTVANAAGMPDPVTGSAVNAREEIGRAIAARVRETSNVYELKKVAEDVLPEIEKFLESPAEKRLRRLRTGTLIAAIGLGTVISMSAAAILANDDGIFFIAGLGGVTFFIGLAFWLNGYFSTVPERSLTDTSADAARQLELDAEQQPALGPERSSFPASVTEHTTTHLGEKIPRR